MQISEEHSAATDSAPGRTDGYEFVTIGATDEAFPKLKSVEMSNRFYRWGIKLNEELFVRKFRYNQVFHPVGADEFLKHLFNSDAVRAQLPSMADIGDVQNVSFKQMTATVTNMSYFDFLEDMGIVNPNTSALQGCLEEYIHGIPCGDKLRTGLLFEEDENYDELQSDKY